MYGITKAAEKDLRLALAQADKLLSVTISPTFRRVKAMAFLNLSELLLLKGEGREAHNTADRAVALLNSFTSSPARSNATAEHQWLLSMALTDRGAASEALGDYDTASRDFDSAEMAATQVGRQDEAYEDAQYQLAHLANVRAAFLANARQQYGASVQSYNRASAILERLIKDHALIPHYREELAVTASGRAAVHMVVGDIPAAQRDCKTARELVERLIDEQSSKGDPENPTYLSIVARVLVQESEIYRLEGRADERRKTLAKAKETLNRVIEMDPTRSSDKVILDRITTNSAQLPK